jgi:CRP-like cAMP-binding protein
MASGENLILQSLPREERARLDPFIQTRNFETQAVLIHPNEPISEVLFPYSLVTSTIQELSDGSAVETGLMGIEGVVGVQLWLKVPTTPTRTIVQVAGRAHRISAEDFEREVMHQPRSVLNIMIARYIHAFLCMTSQAAACNRLHSVDQRLCRWLKLVHNRVRRDEFPMRQEFLALMLGVQRPTLSTAAHMLAQAGLITYSRGLMKVLDPDGLEQGSCECYGLMEAQMNRVYEKPWRQLALEQDRLNND